MPTFPLPRAVTHSYLPQPPNSRHFDSPRANPPGRRHGAVDLYCPHGTPVLACETGVCTVEGLPNHPCPYAFVRYDQSAPHVLALEVKCDSGLVIRYGECLFLPHVKRGYRVHEGEQIGWTVRMKGLTPPGDCMLHFELYQGTLEGPLSQPSALPYCRRADLLNPTVYLTTRAQLTPMASATATSLPYLELPSVLAAPYLA